MTNQRMQNLLLNIIFKFKPTAAINILSCGAIQIKILIYYMIQVLNIAAAKGQPKIEVLFYKSRNILKQQ